MCGLLAAVASLVAEHGSRVLWLQELQCVAPVVVAHGFIAQRHVGSSQTRDCTPVPGIGQRPLNHWTTGEALHASLLCETVILVSSDVSN